MNTNKEKVPLFFRQNRVPKIIMAVAGMADPITTQIGLARGLHEGNDINKVLLQQHGIGSLYLTEIGELGVMYSVLFAAERLQQWISREDKSPSTDFLLNKALPWIAAGGLSYVALANTSNVFGGPALPLPPVPWWHF